MANSYTLIGIMSGTSMDGVDLAHVTFSRNDQEKWHHIVHATRTVSYPKELLEALRISTRLSVEEMCRLDKALGRFFGAKVNEFIGDFQLSTTEIDAIASHGHTVFHQPQKGFTLQIGCGTTIASITQIKVINDFRTKDVVNGGQGAPLVPIGDTILFADLADAFLNIGGFANICLKSDPVIAFDIGPGNLPLNQICQEHFNQLYDINGEIAANGTMLPRIFDILNDLDYYHESAPKSLGTEWLTEVFNPLLKSYENENPRDLLHTITRHFAYQISSTLNNNGVKSVLVTGGGAKNAFLVSQIREHFNGEVIIPSKELIDFKEAIVFGFLGALYLDGQPNTIASVTGAKIAVCGGVLHTP